MLFIDQGIHLEIRGNVNPGTLGSNTDNRALGIMVTFTFHYNRRGAAVTSISTSFIPTNSFIVSAKCKCIILLGELRKTMSA